MDILIHHPMFLRTIPDVNHQASALTRDTDQRVIENMSSYTIQDIPLLTPPDDLPAEQGFGCRFLNWIRRKRLHLRHLCGGLLDTHNQHIYPIDLLGEKNGEPVLVVMYYSPRCDKQSYHTMKLYADRVGNLCYNDYKMACHLWLLNIYGPRGNRSLKTHALYYGPE